MFGNVLPRIGPVLPPPVMQQEKIGKVMKDVSVRVGKVHTWKSSHNCRG